MANRISALAAITAVAAVPVIGVCSAAHAQAATSFTKTAVVTSVVRDAVKPASVVHSSAPVTTQVPTVQIVHYTVKSGDTLSAISVKFYGTSADYPQIASQNNIPNANLIFAGQHLVINAHETVVVTVNVTPHAPSTPTSVPKHVAPHAVFTPAPTVHTSAHHSWSVSHNTVTHSSTTQNHVNTPSVSGTSGGVNWDKLVQCEASGNWSANTGNGFHGGLQFTQSTWNAYGGSGSAANASRAEQIAVAQKVLASQGGANAWPASHARGAACGF